MIWFLCQQDWVDECEFGIYHSNSANNNSDKKCIYVLELNNILILLMIQGHMKRQTSGVDKLYVRITIVVKLTDFISEVIGYGKASYK